MAHSDQLTNRDRMVVRVSGWFSLATLCPFSVAETIDDPWTVIFAVAFWCLSGAALVVGHDSWWPLAAVVVAFIHLVIGAIVIA